MAGVFHGAEARLCYKRDLLENRIAEITQTLRTEVHSIIVENDFLDFPR